MDPEIGDDLCLFLDVDGTLIDIAPRPEAVVVPRQLVVALGRTAQALGGAVALISGRTIADLDRLFAPLQLSASGVHGAEVRFEPGAAIIEDHDNLLEPGMVAAIEEAARGIDGTVVENKRYSVAVHFRQVPHTAPALRAELEGIIAAARDPQLRIMPGHMVFEVKRATFDKGLAVARFMARAPFSKRIPVFLGDDVTDRPGFAAVLERGGRAYSVGPALPGTSGSFSEPAAVRSWLAGFAAETRHV